MELLSHRISNPAVAGGTGGSGSGSGSSSMNVRSLDVAAFLPRGALPEDDTGVGLRAGKPGVLRAHPAAADGMFHRHIGR